MDKERRSRLKSVVGQTRRIVEDDVRVQLRRLGIDENEIKPVDRLPHLSNDDKELRQKLVEALEKERAGDISYGEAFDRYVKHVGFTYVNRIAALRAMEVRNLVKETVIRRDVYGGRSRREYELAERERVSDPYEMLKAGLVEAFNEVSVEIRVLFDVNSEYSSIFLGHKALSELIRLLSEEVPEEDWKEDDVIGWIYQYYNEEARAEFKRAKRKPKADDIPVINQFYTPRWVVRVLVDNTLGRLWLEMNGHCPKLGDSIKRTKEELENPAGEKVDDFCSYLVPLSQEPPTRERKRVREIKVLDPACGSGHFLIYAFDVLFRMYRADEPDTPVEEIPRLILENNLFGIDIDLRAVQLAALSLYLKAKSYNAALKITRMNLVCADARITDGRVRKVFLERFADDPELQKIFAKIFEDLEYTFEIGSLLKVREPFEKLLEKREREGGVQVVLIPQLEGQTAISRSRKIEGQAKLDMGVAENSAAQIIAVPREATLEQMLNALKEFEREAMEKRDMGTLLFATEAEKSVGLLGLLSQNYEVILMNPPYGDMPVRTKEHLRKHYPRTHFDYYAAFIEQTITLCNYHGYLGMLTSSTFLSLKWFTLLREEIFWKEAVPSFLLDLGSGVLDVAWAQWAATVLRKVNMEDSRKSAECKSTFFRLRKHKDEQSKKLAFEKAVDDLARGNESETTYTLPLKELKKIPGTRYAYWAPSSVRDLFTKHPPLDRDVAKVRQQVKIADVKVGLQTSDDARFKRFFWEVPFGTIGMNPKNTYEGKVWIPYSRGTWLSPFYEDILLVINWKKNGEELKSDEKAVIRNEQYYFHEGLTWMTSPQMGTIIKGTLKRINIRRLPPFCIFAVNNSGLFSKENMLWGILGLLNSSVSYYLLRLQVPRNLDVGSLATLPFPKNADLSEIAHLARECHDILKEWDFGSETSTIFIEPRILQVLHGFDTSLKPKRMHPLAAEFCWTNWPCLEQIRKVKGTEKYALKELAQLCVRREHILRQRVAEILDCIDEQAFNLYEVLETDRHHIQLELGTDKKEHIIEIQNGIKDHIIHLLSFYVRKAIESDPDGVIPLPEIAHIVGKYIASDFAEDQFERREQEIQEIIGKSLEDWLVEDFFSSHIDLYKRRPIFWHLTSTSFSTSRGSRGTVNIFLNYQKLDRDMIPKILANYLKPELESTKWKTERLKRELQESRDQSNKTKEKELSKELDRVLSMLEELQNFQNTLETVHNPRLDKTKLPKNPTWLQQKIAEVRDNGYSPVIDYGVRVNIEPLKEAGLLHKAAQRVK